MKWIDFDEMDDDLQDEEPFKEGYDGHFHEEFKPLKESKIEDADDAYIALPKELSRNRQDLEEPVDDGFIIEQDRVGLEKDFPDVMADELSYEEDIDAIGAMLGLRMPQKQEQTSQTTFEEMNARLTESLLEEEKETQAQIEAQKKLQGKKLSLEEKLKSIEEQMFDGEPLQAKRQIYEEDTDFIDPLLYEKEQEEPEQVVSQTFEEQPESTDSQMFEEVPQQMGYQTFEEESESQAMSNQMFEETFGQEEYQTFEKASEQEEYQTFEEASEQEEYQAVDEMPESEEVFEQRLEEEPEQPYEDTLWHGEKTELEEGDKVQEESQEKEKPGQREKKGFFKRLFGKKDEFVMEPVDMDRDQILTEFFGEEVSNGESALQENYYDPYEFDEDWKEDYENYRTKHIEDRILERKDTVSSEKRILHPDTVVEEEQPMPDAEELLAKAIELEEEAERLLSENIGFENETQTPVEEPEPVVVKAEEPLPNFELEEESEIEEVKESVPNFEFEEDVFEAEETIAEPEEYATPEEDIAEPEEYATPEEDVAEPEEYTVPKQETSEQNSLPEMEKVRTVEEFSTQEEVQKVVLTKRTVPRRVAKNQRKPKSTFRVKQNEKLVDFDKEQELKEHKEPPKKIKKLQSAFEEEYRNTLEDDLFVRRPREKRTRKASSRRNLWEEDDDSPDRPLREFFGLILSIFLVVLLTFLLVNYVGQRTQVNGSSMEDTLHDGDNLIVDKISYAIHEPERFDIIVFPYESASSDEDVYYIKRIIGLPGEKVQISNGFIYINGELLEEAYGKNQELILNAGRAEREIQLRDDEYFVLGDNRNNSSDSREIGNIKRDIIVGKAWVRIWPLSDFGILKHQ